MVSPLSGSLAATIYGAMKNLFLDAVLTRDVIPDSPAYNPADPPAPVSVDYPCKAIREEYGLGFRVGGLIDLQDFRVIILQNSLSTIPIPLDRITITGMGGPFTIVPPGIRGQPAITADPANATWECRARN